MEKPKYQVLAVGELNPDLILTGLSELPELGREKLASGFAQRLGSSTAIAAAQMSRLGLDVSMVSKVGNDVYGWFCQEELAKMQVDTSNVLVSDSDQTGVTISLSYPSERMLVTYLGSIASLRSSDVKDCVLAQGKHLHVSAYYLQHSLRADCLDLFTRAKRLGLTISLDTGDDPSGNWDSGIWQVLPLVDIFLPNESELLSIARDKEVESAIGKIGSVCPLVAAKLGSKGSMLFSHGKIQRFSPFPVDVVDTTGAGDSFNAGFIYGFLNGRSLEECMLLANACGALSTTSEGGTSGFNGISEVVSFLEKR